MAAYSAALKKCSVHCAFGIFLEKALRDRFVSCVRNKPTQKRLLAYKNLTWKSAVEIALSMEIADRHENNFRNPPSESEVNYVKLPLSEKKESRVFDVAIPTCHKSTDSET